MKMRMKLKKEKPDCLLVMDLASCLISIPASFGLDIKIIVSERNSPQNFPGKPIVAKLSRFLMQFANGFVFQTLDAKSFYEKITNNRGVIIPNPLIINELPEPYYGIRKKEIVTAGRLTSQKNQELLIRAYSLINKKFPEYNLIIYGEGELREYLENICVNLKIENQVFFPGNIPNLLDKIRTSSLFVMSSDYEGMPNALLEAMALGLPCISTDCPCGGPKAVINNNINGVLVPVKDEILLAKKMDYLLSNQVYANSLGEKACSIRNELDSEIICEKWLKYIQNLEGGMSNK